MIPKMHGECVDEGIAGLHDGFVGRGAVLAELDRVLVDNTIDRCVVVTGGRGTGKTAILARWVARREAARDLVAYHFVRRQRRDRVEPSLIACSLAAQLEDRFPALRDAHARPQARLGELLARVSATALAPQRRRMWLVVDGLDDGHPMSELRQLQAMLPRELPPGIRCLCAGRLSRSELDAWPAHLDLDDPSLAGDNDATVRAYWRREAGNLGLDDRFVEAAVRSAEGNLLHATLLRQRLACAPCSLHRLDAIPFGLAALFSALWQRVADDAAAVQALGILCAARVPLSLASLGHVAGWTDPTEQRAATIVARELITETTCDGETVYRPCHEAVRGYILGQLGALAIRAHHQALADKLAAWPPSPGGGLSRRYALRHAIGHRIAAGNCTALHALVRNRDLLEAKCRERGVDEVELDVRRAAEACMAAGQIALSRDLDELARAIAGESSALRSASGADAAAAWSRVFTRPPRASSAPSLSQAVSGRIEHPNARPARPSASPGQPSASLGRPNSLLGRVNPMGATDVRTPIVPPPVAPPTPPSARLRDLSRAVGVTACAVTHDGRAIAAVSDGAIQIWDLRSGRLLSTLTGHTGAIARCAVTADGRRLVSASADTTLKVWDLMTGHALITLAGHAATVESCAIVPGSRRVVSASADATLKIWDLDTGHVVTTLAQHTDAVTDCAVTPDGRRVVSASADTTLKVWELATGDVVATLVGHGCEVTSCAVVGGGRRVVSGASDATLTLWDVETASAISSLTGHTGAVTHCAVAPGGRRMYSASCDSTLKVWDLDTGRVVSTLARHTAPVACCAIASDGRLVSGSADDTLQVWSSDGTPSMTVYVRGKPASSLAPPPALPAIAPVPSPIRTPRDHKPRADQRNVILFLAANPKDTTRIDLDKECAAIERELRWARHGNDFEFHSKWAVTVDEMARHLMDLEPTIVHFSGHGRRDASDTEAQQVRDIAGSGDAGIYVHDEDGGVQLVTGRALSLLVASSAPSARVVVLNACYSDGHAEALCHVVDCVVGMSRAIHDNAARSFSVAFYRALGHRYSIGGAVQHAVATLACKQLSDESVPRCRTHNWVDAAEIKLSAEG